MDKFKFAFGLHNHQPVGNFEHVFEEAHQQAYQPFLELFEKYRSLRISLHQSGILWEWQEKHHPEYIDMVQKLVDSDRLELMTGGYYEPILPSIPDRDKLGQIALLNEYLESKFNVTPTGLWLTERVWEPHLPKYFSQVGVEYLPIDDTHFIYAGFDPEALRGVFVTEEEGYKVKLLPIQKKQRYLIPFGKVEEIIDELKQQAESNPGGLAIYADDGEKFGVWPQTHQHCYTGGWLDDMFKAFEDNSDWLEICPLNEAAASRPVGIAHLPTASYSEMLHWALPSKGFTEYEELENYLIENGKMERFGRFIRGGHWRGFLAKYPEANLMHKKMLNISSDLESFEHKYPERTEAITEAKRFLYAGQCNCPYWHGVFGGLYLPHLRQAIYENLIKAEKMLLPPNLKSVEKTISDYDCDGHDEIIVKTGKMGIVIKPSMGGMMLEMDNYEASANLLDTLSRRKEGYHRKLSGARFTGEKRTDETASIHDIVLTKEQGLDQYLAEDWYLRRGFIDHFLAPETEIDEYLASNFRDEGNFVLEPYEYSTDSGRNQVVLERIGRLWHNNTRHRLKAEKRYIFGPKSEVVSVSYALTAVDNDISDIRFAVENNFNFQAGHSDDRYILFDGEKAGGGFLDTTVVRKNNYSAIMYDSHRDLVAALSVDRENEIWQMPIFTISLSEGGFEKVYQGTSIVYVIKTDLIKDKPFEMTFLLYSGRMANLPPMFKRNRAGISLKQ
jgi:alpha-amylase